MTASDSFSRTDDAATFDTFSGAAAPADDFSFVFNPVALRRSSRTNSASLGSSYAFNEKSGLSLQGSHTMRDYERATASEGLTDQQRIAASIAYNRRTSTRDTLSAGYSVTYFDFADYRDAFSQGGYVGFSTQFSPSLSLQLSAGASRVRSSRSGGTYVGLNASASLQKTLQTSSFLISYVQSSGEASGLGSISDTRRVSLSLRRDWRDVNLSINASAFDTRRQLDNTFNIRGISGAAQVGVPLTRTLSFAGGVQYQEYDHASPHGFGQKRVFVSLRYVNPTLVRFSP